MVDVIHVHEDDWGMRNLYPLAARAEAERDIAEAAAASERNRDPSGFGWTAMYIAQPPSMDYADAGLTLAVAEAALAPILPRVGQFNATIFSAMRSSGPRDPYGVYEEDSWCFGLGPHCYLKLDPKGDLVGGIWFDFASDDPADEARLRRAIQAINALVPSIIADYFLDETGPISAPGFLDAYFASLAETRRAAEQAMLAYRAQTEAVAPAPGLMRKLLAIFGGRGR